MRRPKVQELEDWIDGAGRPRVPIGGLDVEWLWDFERTG